MVKSVPYWRLVKDTDDGCALYQCLACKSHWEGRSEPGWFDSFEDCEPDAEGAMSYLLSDGTPYYYRNREVPVYEESWKYCPHCGVRWLGPIRCNVENERMLGPRRLRQYNAMWERRIFIGGWDYWKPSYWWVIQQLTEYVNADERWVDKFKLNPEKVNAIQVYKCLKARRAELKAEDSEWETNYARVVIKTNAELENGHWSKFVTELTDVAYSE